VRILENRVVSRDREKGAIETSKVERNRASRQRVCSANWSIVEQVQDSGNIKLQKGKSSKDSDSGDIKLN
jgi:hypothetical protein